MSAKVRMKESRTKAKIQECINVEGMGLISTKQ